MFSPYFPPLCWNVQPLAQACAALAISLDQASDGSGAAGAGTTAARAALCAESIASAIGLPPLIVAVAPPLARASPLATSELEQALSARAHTSAVRAASEDSG